MWRFTWVSLTVHVFEHHMNGSFVHTMALWSSHYRQWYRRSRPSLCVLDAAELSGLVLADSAGLPSAKG